MDEELDNTNSLFDIRNRISSIQQELKKVQRRKNSPRNAQERRSLQEQLDEARQQLVGEFERLGQARALSLRSLAKSFKEIQRFFEGVKDREPFIERGVAWIKANKMTGFKGTDPEYSLRRMKLAPEERLERLDAHIREHVCGVLPDTDNMRHLMLWAPAIVEEATRSIWRDQRKKKRQFRRENKSKKIVNPFDHHTPQKIEDLRADEENKIFLSMSESNREQLLEAISKNLDGIDRITGAGPHTGFIYYVRVCDFYGPFKYGASPNVSAREISSMVGLSQDTVDKRIKWLKQNEIKVRTKIGAELIDFPLVMIPPQKNPTKKRVK